MQAALLRVVLERVVGDLELPADVSVVAAAHLSRPPTAGTCRRGWSGGDRAVKGAGEVGGVPGLAAARLWAASRFPYLATGLFGAHVIAASGIGTVAVDEGWRMHADPELAAQWTPAQLGSVLVHHVSHLLRAHGERAAPAGVTPDRAAVWVRCADAEINDDLVPAGL